MTTRWVRLGWRRLIELEPDLRVVTECGDGAQALAALTGQDAPAVDVLVLDLSMPGSNGLDLLRQLHQRGTGLRVVVSSMHDGPAMVAQVLRAGAAGFVPKSADPQRLIDAIRTVAAGGSAVPPALADAARSLGSRLPHESLTPREAEVLHHLLAGDSIEAIARAMGLSDKTVSQPPDPGPPETRCRQRPGAAALRAGAWSDRLRTRRRPMPPRRTGSTLGRCGPLPTGATGAFLGSGRIPWWVRDTFSNV
jgi:DNA-binding NarL/FixJ family response regulator